MADFETRLSKKTFLKLKRRPELIRPSIQDTKDMDKEGRLRVVDNKSVWGQVLAKAMVVADIAHEQDVFPDVSVSYQGHFLDGWQIAEAAYASSSSGGLIRRGMILTRSGILYETVGVGQQGQFKNGTFDSSRLHVLDDTDFVRLETNPRLADTIESDLMQFAETHNL